MKKTVSRILSILSSMAVAVMFVACGGDEPEPTPDPTPTPTPTPTTVAVTGVSLNKSSLTLTEGGSETLTATVSPGDATNKNVNWTSSDASVATVDGSGKVTAVKPGTSTLIVTSADGGKTATCSVTVEAKKIPVTGVKLDKDTAELVEGEELTLTATVAPENATETTVEWSTSSTEVATVEGGKVTAVAPGSATITVKTKDGGKTATCKVTVIAKTIAVEGVTMDIETETLELKEGDKTTIKVTVTPEDASDKSVEWSSSDKSVVTIDAEGKVTAVGTGTATITVKTKDGGKTATIKVTVAAKEIPVEGITFTKDNVSVMEGEKVLLYVSFTPKNPTNKKVTWKSSNTAVATVDTKGNVTGVKAGTAKITVTTIDGGKTSTCTVTVTKKPVAVEKVTLNRTALSMTVDSEADLVATVSPNDATNKQVTWSSSNEDVATVDQNGGLKAKKVGTATITVKTADGGKTATCTVTVTKQQVNATGVKLDKTTLSIMESNTAQLTATVQPSNATDHSVTWSSSNESVAKVDQTGKVTAVKAGTATITVKTKNNKTATCKVTVTGKLVTKITLNVTSKTINVGEYFKITPTITPSDAANKSVSWSSGNISVATVDYEGNVRGIGAGTATITCTAKDGSNQKATCTVTVKAIAVTGISLGSGASLPLGIYDGGPSQTTTMSYTITPSNATNKAVRWSSSNTSIVTVDSNGLIKGLKAGRATITVTTVDGGYSASRDVIVSHFIPISRIVLTSSFTMKVGDTVGIDYTLEPTNPTYKSLDWTSSDPATVKIVQNSTSTPSNWPYVKALKKGRVTMTAKARDGSGTTATCTITVTD